MERKRPRKTCPSCKQSFSSRYFYNHKKDNFYCGSWSCGKGEQKNVEVIDEFEFSFHANVGLRTTTSSSDENIDFDAEYLKAKIEEKHESHEVKYMYCETESLCWARGVPDHLLLFQDSPQVSEDEPDVLQDEYYNEQWEEVTGEEVQEDLSVFIVESPQNKKKNSLLLVKWICTFICCWQAMCFLPDVAVDWLLRFLKAVLDLIGEHSTYVNALAAALPSSLYLLWNFMKIDRNNFVKYAVCPSCNSIYILEDAVIAEGGKSKSKTCSYVRFPNHRQKWRRKPCGDVLMKKVTLQNGKEVLYPRKIFCYKSVIQSLKCLLHQNGFLELCEEWRERSIPEGILTDVTDGCVWKEFKDFFKGAGHYGLMMNFDFFQPFKHGKYSVGVFYLTLMNLPRSLRFKPENVILVGVVPPIDSGTSLNPFLKPLIEDLQSLWDDGFMMSEPFSTKDITFKAALLCVACDLPAARKIVGFLSHSANRGCSKCLKIFPGGFGNKNYSGFNRNHWVDRTEEDHKRKYEELKACQSQEDLNALQTEYGIRLSALCGLSYFSAIRFTIIDPMHNLYLGTAKRMVELWLELNIISEKQLKDIQARVDSVHTASDVGRIPRKIASSFGAFTADQWKNWTNLFSIFALHGILPKQHLECWRYFVLASRLLTSRIINVDQIKQADQLLLKFCTSFEELYGEQYVTPNMHMHGHLISSLLDYGPVYSFWLFSYERYNGILGNFPTNQKSVEVQLMRRFLQDNLVMNVELPQEYSETLRPLLDYGRNTRLSGSLRETMSDPHAVLNVLNYVTLPINEIHAWECDLAICKLQLPKQKCMFSEGEYQEFVEVYRILYPSLAGELDEEKLPRSFWKYKGCEFCGQYLGSTASSAERSSLVLAAWLGCRSKIDDSACERPCQVQSYILHYLMINDVPQPHVFAKVRWFQSVPDDFRYSYGKPVELWSASSFEVEAGSASYLPIQRVRCKFIAGYGQHRCIGRVMYVIPRTGLVHV